MNMINTFLKKHPKLLFNYVSFNLKAVELILNPLSAVMKHCLIIQGLDPNTVPGVKQFKEFEADLNRAFDIMQMKDYDDDYNPNFWQHKSFNKTKVVLKDLNLTQESFNRLTDLSKLKEDESLKVAELPLPKISITNDVVKDEVLPPKIKESKPKSKRRPALKKK